MKPVDTEILDIAAKAIGLNPDDRMSPDIFAGAGTTIWGGADVRSMLAWALNAAAPHMYAHAYRTAADTILANGGSEWYADWLHCHAIELETGS